MRFLEVLSCVKSGVWSERTLEANINGVAGEIQAAAIGGTEFGGIFEVMMCDFKVISDQPGIVRFHGRIDELRYQIGI